LDTTISPKIRLSILDQSPVISGHSASDAIAATIDLAQMADDLGYSRYWCAEHHGLRGVCNPCPEVMLARLGSVTRRIRLGTGGIMLPYYSPFKVAEQFRMLEAMFPGRIDLGVGRAPGGEQRTSRLVAWGRYDPDVFPDQVMDLIALTRGPLPPGHEAAGIPLQPMVDSCPELWMLGMKWRATTGRRSRRDLSRNPIARWRCSSSARIPRQRPSVAWLLSTCAGSRWPMASMRRSRRWSRRLSGSRMPRRVRSRSRSGPEASSARPEASSNACSNSGTCTRRMK
jgi:hypothetical protein